MNASHIPQGSVLGALSGSGTREHNKNKRVKECSAFLPKRCFLRTLGLGDGLQRAGKIMALAKCKECGGDVATSAKTCPHCGAPPPKRLNKVAALILLVVIAIPIIGVMRFANTMFSSPGPSTANTAVIADLRPKQPQCRENLQQLEQLGVKVTDVSGITAADYDETAWAALEHDGKIKQALLVFCAKMPPDGHYTILIRGLHDGKTKASVVDGNYIDA